MKKVKLLHNPGAGDEAHSEEKLVSLIETQGFECSYVSIKENDWANFETQPDFLIAAGGDGTVRRITKELLKQKNNKILPIAILPLGTANNVAKTLGIQGRTEDIIRSWHKSKLKKYDTGTFKHADKEHFFLESLGYGMFQYMMGESGKENKKEEGEPEKRIKSMLKILHDITLSYKPSSCDLKIDGIDHSGKYILVEIMNSKSMGPNLVLAPDASTEDGKLDIVLITEDDKEKFASYLMDKINGTEDAYSPPSIKARQVKISWNGTHAHTDDKIIDIKKNSEIIITLNEGSLEFLVPA